MSTSRSTRTVPRTTSRTNFCQFLVYTENSVLAPIARLTLKEDMCVDGCSPLIITSDIRIYKTEVHTKIPMELPPRALSLFRITVTNS